ncbi:MULTISPECIES: efflux transporter outer membrane subunit [Brevundimonas]|uniref:efflux transporter outer membrane subunit n=1 Tax=Brevundimonas TaxID=41275 RepID=UPI003208A7FD
MKAPATLALMAAVLSTAACQTAPKAPATDVVAASYPLVSPIDTANAVELAWQDVLRDARLQRLVDLALTDSRDLRLAVLDAEEARAQLRIRRADPFPQVDANAGMTRGRASQNSGQGGNAETQSQYSAGLALTAFELDLFGRLRAQSRSAFEAWLAAEEGRNAARIVVISTVAEAYLAERAADERLALTQSTLEDWRASLRLAQQLREAGQSSGLEVAQAEGQVRSAEADLEAALRTRQVAVNALVLAVGAPLPEGLPAPMRLADRPVQTELPAGVPADLLERRPDIRQAEHQLAAANADVTVARAAFFPRLSLTGLLGVASGDLGDLFNGDSDTWSFAPQITVPIFHAGRLKGALDVAQIRSDKAVTTYERTLQTAFREVADGLAARATFERQIEAQSGAVTAADQRARLSELRFRAGVDSRLELLDAQRQLYAARLAMVDLRQAQATASVQLYRALGGGVRGRS